jgi:hypothetical protein
MKRPLLLLLLISSFCHAQNYQCLQSGVKRYFINSNGYLRGIRIDSTEAYADSIVYYPFQTPRGPVSSLGGSSILDYHSGSWLGKRVLQYADGSFLFDNDRNRKTIIKTQASVGDSWVLYQDSTTHFYQALVLSADTMTVLGSVDSVKTILINAIDSSGIDTTDPANGYQVMISKNYGFVQIFDLFTFPYRDSAGITSDFYHHICGSQIFHLIHFHNPEMREIYNYEPGDFYEYHIERNDEHPYVAYHSDNVISKAIIDSTHTSVTFMQKTWTLVPWPPSETYDDKITTVNVFSDPRLLIDTSLMPEENGQNSYYHYYPGNDPTCYLSDAYSITSRYLFNLFEPCGDHCSYKIGLGNTLTANCYEPPNLGYSSQLIYYVKNGVSCGSYYNIPSAVNSPQIPPSSIALFPNPATTDLTIFATGKITSISISNLIGQTVYSQECNTLKASVDVSTLPAGVYLVRVNDTEVRKFVKQ